MEAESGRSLVDCALSYARRNWPVFPLKPRGKLPLTVRGFKDATCDEATIKAWWQRWPDANIGLPTGEASGVSVIDIDPRHGGDVSMAALVDAHGPLPTTLEASTGGGGRHLFFQHAPGLRNTAGKLGAGIDTRGDGGYVVIACSVHESGGVYSWIDEDENIPPAPLPAWLDPRNSSGAPQLAAGNLAFVAGPAKANGQPVAVGGRNQAAASLAGQYVRAGDSLIDVMRKLREWNATNPDPLPTKELEQTVASITRTHLNNNPASEIRVADPPLMPAPRRTTFPVHLLNPPGAVGQITKWINETAIKPQPVLALGNALAFFGAVIGRKVRTPTNLRSNLYVLGVGASGCGKDHSRKCVKEICEAAGLTAQLLGGEEVSSDSAILAAVHNHPSILFQFDEIGHFLANANSKYAAVHQKNIAPTFTKLFSSANTTFIGKEYAGRTREDIVQPNVCLYGTTVPERLYDGMTPAEVSDGFLGRMLAMMSDDPDPIEHEHVHSPVPESIVTIVQAWVTRNDMPRAEGNIASLAHIPITVPLDEDARAVFAQFRTRCRQERETHRGELDVLWTRAAEHALKVALTIAAGCEYQAPAIGGDVAEYAVQLVAHLVDQLCITVGQSIASSDHHRRLQKFARIIRDAGPAGISRTKLLIKTQGFTSKQRDEILSQLIEMGSIARREGDAARGSKGTVYYAQ